MDKHTCHWPGCKSQVPPRLWGCKKHWFMLPKHLRDKVWSAYVPGQEISKTPSPEYVRVAEEVQAWIKGRTTALVAKKARRQRNDDDESFADRAIAAQLAIECGEETDDAWLLP